MVTAVSYTHLDVYKRQELGYSSIKIDTHKENFVMRGLLEKNGFEYCGIILLEDGAERVAYEKLF